MDRRRDLDRHLARPAQRLAEIAEDRVVSPEKVGKTVYAIVRKGSMEYAYLAGGVALGAIVTTAIFLLRPKPTSVAATVAAPSAPPPPAPPKPTAEAVRFLALLQAEARFFDFLMEDVSAFSDAQIGQAVRDIHRKSKAAIEQHLVLEPILPQAEGATVTVPAGFDASKIRVLGNVSGAPPFTGSLAHPGWRVREVKLAPPAAGADVFVIQPAEVQIA
jgi:hypothetical protein